MRIRDNASGRTAVRHLGTSQGRLAKALEKAVQRLSGESECR